MKGMRYGYVYETRNLLNGRLYVGLRKSAKFISSYLGSGLALKRAIKKYGANQFAVRLLAWCGSMDELAQTEMKMIAEYREKCGIRGLYNVARGGYPWGGGMTGVTVSERSRRKLSRALKGIPKPKGFGEHLSQMRRERGLRPSLETCRKGGFGCRGTHWSAMARARVTGRKMPEYARQKLSQRMLGNINGRANKGRVMSAEWRRKLAESHRGLKHSPEHIARFRESIMRTWAGKSAGEKKLTAERLMRPRMIRYLLRDAEQAFQMIDNPLTLERLSTISAFAELGVPSGEVPV